MEKNEKAHDVEVVEARDLPGKLAEFLRSEAEARGVAAGTECKVKLTASLIGDPNKAAGQTEAARTAVYVEICGEWDFLKQSMCFRVQVWPW